MLDDLLASSSGNFNAAEINKHGYKGQIGRRKSLYRTPTKEMKKLSSLHNPPYNYGC